MNFEVNFYSNNCLTFIKEEIISVLTKLDFYYSLEAMQYTGSTGLSKDINIHCCN